MVGLSRRMDRWLGTRTGVYGWAFWFGKMPESVDTTVWPNVCIRIHGGVTVPWRVDPPNLEVRAMRWRESVLWATPALPRAASLNYGCRKTPACADSNSESRHRAHEETSEDASINS